MKGHEHTIQVCKEHGTTLAQCRCPSSVKRRVEIACPGHACEMASQQPTKETDMATKATTSTPSAPAAPKAKKLLSIGVPIKLANLQAMLGMLDTTDRTTVRYYNGELRIEEPPAELEDVSVEQH